MNKIKWILLIMGLLIIPNLANAWNYTGHVVIAQIAYDNLTPTAKQKADKLADIIYDNLPEYQQHNLVKYYPNASTFAKIAELPDVWRKENLWVIFTNNITIPPFNLLLYSLVSTRSFHYINLPYPASSQCQEFQPFNVVWAINKLETSFHSAKSANTQAVLMVLEEHYIGDIHQPLHTISRVDNNCNNDEGGNDFCIRWNSYHDKCFKSLHSLWDSGVGYIYPNENVQSIVYDLEQQYPKSQFVDNLQDTDPMDWAKANYSYANFIYSLTEGERPTPQYYQQGQSIAKKQLALAGYRLAEVLNSQLN